MKLVTTTTTLFITILTTCCCCCYTTTIASSNNDTATTASWCKTTPYPDPCSYFTARHVPANLSDFRHVAVRVAADVALAAHRHVSSRGPTCRGANQRSAWSDCVKLYDDTVSQLTRVLDSLGGRHVSTASDLQTWLSAALTNIRTCRDGSRDLGVPDFTADANVVNVSRLVSNCLAVNARFVAAEESSNRTIHGFGMWRFRRERRALEGEELVGARPQLVVAKDGSGNYRTVQGAINEAARRRGRMGRFVIFVKRGVYWENIEVGKNNNNVVLVGEGMKRTVITGSRSVKGGYTTYSSATAVIDGLHFMARGITFSNTAGPSKGQAVALRSASDLSVFYQCAFMGYQDTLMVHSQRQFFRKCYVFGTVDFIFGNAAAVFQNCLLLLRRPLPGQSNVITAQGRDDPFQNTGIAVHNSRVLAARDLGPVQTYLGRPWQRFSRTVFLRTYLGRAVSPAGWAPWGAGSRFGMDTCYYGEYQNKGPGAATWRRVRWKGYHVITSSRVASRFTVGSLIEGASWLPGTGVPYTTGL